MSDSKIPLKLDGFPASPTDPDTWFEFQDIQKRINSGFFTHTGFVFANDGYIGIDIDKGFNEDGTLTDMAYNIISTCKSYTERSKSKRGFHIILKGTLGMAGANNFNGVEIYRDKRYFVTTGDVFIYKNIIENQEAIDYVVETYFPVTETENEFRSENIYPIKYSYELKQGVFSFTPSFDYISEGGRHISLVSAAGQFCSLGYDLQNIIEKLTYINQNYCLPPLSQKEINQIAKSIAKYRR